MRNLPLWMKSRQNWHSDKRTIQSLLSCFLDLHTFSKFVKLKSRVDFEPFPWVIQQPGNKFRLRFSKLPQQNDWYSLHFSMWQMLAIRSWYVEQEFCRWCAIEELRCISEKTGQLHCSMLEWRAIVCFPPRNEIRWVFDVDYKNLSRKRVFYWTSYGFSRTHK